MSHTGHFRRFEREPATSVYPPTPDIHCVAAQMVGAKADDGDVRGAAPSLASMPLSAINGNPWVARPYF